MKHIKGTRNPTAMEEISAIHPISIGTIAPPATAITIIEEAFSRNSPSPLMPSANIVGYMIDIKK